MRIEIYHDDTDREATRMGWLKNILGMGSPEEKELERIKKETAQLSASADIIKKEISDLERQRESIKAAINDEQAYLDLKNSVIDLKKERQRLSNDITDKKNQIIILDDDILLQDISLYQPMYDLQNSEQYKEKLQDIRDMQKSMIKDGTAATGATDWLVNNSRKEGRKMVKDTIKLLLKAFNSECEFVTWKVKYNNFESCRARIEKAFTTINKLGTSMQITISDTYLRLKIQELHCAFEYAQKKQEEAEQRRELRAQEREEARLQKEIEEERKKIKKEQTLYSNALAAAKAQLAKEQADEAEKAALLEKIKQLESQIQETDKQLADVDYRETNQRAGYVYVISNIGAFGNDIYKIGMTRRLNPQERVDELGDASVPFNFDVHAMIFSNDAPTLEAALHNAFADRKLNMVNTRREFFHVTLDEIENVVKKNFDGSVEFIRTAPAEQYRESLKLRELASAKQ